jgi:cell division inhibitor SulA
MKPAVAELLHNPLVWRGDGKARVEHAVASGFVELDRELPGGGWPQGSLTELLVDHEGIGELRLLLPALGRLARSGAWIALVASPHLPYAPAFAGAGIDPARVVIVDAGEEKDRWWAAEQVLRADSAAVLLFWPQSISDARLRRLAVAAQDTVMLAFLFSVSARAVSPSPAPLRIRLSPDGGELRLDVFKRRGGVTSRPLRLDVAAAAFSGSGENRPAGESVRPLLRPDRPAASRLASFNRRYPVGIPAAQIWNRALARADEVRRVPGPDPRGSCANPEPRRTQRAQRF